MATHPAPEGSDFEQMFDMAPVSLWLEDYSGLKALFALWRQNGVTDLDRYLREDASRVQACTRELKILRVNQHTLTLFHAPNLQTLQARLGDVFKDDMHTSVIDELVQLWNGQLTFTNQTCNYTLDGQRLDIKLRARILKGHEDTWARVLLTLENITPEENARKLLTQRESYARNLFELSPVSLWVEDFSAIRVLMDEVRERGIQDFSTFMRVHPDFVTRCMEEIRVIDVNQHTLQMFGADSKSALLHQLDKVFRIEMVDSFQEQLLDLWNGKTFQQREVVNHRLTGESLHIHMQFDVMPGHEARWDMVLVSLVDISARKKAEAYLEYLGKHDVLTKLRNRAYFAEELNRLARKGPWPVSVVAVDVNGLKLINDEQGHAAGDALLRRAGEVLSKSIDAPTCAARIGGDEFVVLMPATDEHGAQALMQRIRSVLELNNQFYPGNELSMAMGAATCVAGAALDTAVQAADHAMYQSKAEHYRARHIERRAGIENL
ncbi:MAG: GGDEF domain-containing protein [Burkholderiales bacterium]|nr:GGDEF domain-containing protein [Burkholderiales bacterium]